MTLAIGVSPGDDSGAVLVTDSLVQERRPDGVRALLCLTPRFERLPGARGAAIISAMTRGGWAPCSTATGIEAAAAELVADLTANLSSTSWRFADGTEAEPRGEVVAAGLDVAGRVRLMRQRTGQPAEWPNAPAIIVGGAAAEIEVARPPPPTTLNEAIHSALALARTILSTDAQRSGYSGLEDALSRGLVPAMAAPFWLAVVTGAGIDIRRIP